jgi:hypothetical protein
VIVHLLTPSLSRSEPPEFESVYISFSSTAGGARNVLITFDSTSEPRRPLKKDKAKELLIRGQVFNKRYQDFGTNAEPIPLLNMYEAEFQRLSEGRVTTDRMDDRLMCSILCVLAVIVEDTATFLSDIVICLGRLVSHFHAPLSPEGADKHPQNFEGRRKPSWHKLHYLTHLEDCFQVSCRGLLDVQHILQNLQQDTQNHAVERGLVESATKILKDITHLKAEFDRVTEDFHSLRFMVAKSNPYLHYTTRN